jgi:hypothetical protein
MTRRDWLTVTLSFLNPLVWGQGLGCAGPSRKQRLVLLEKVGSSSVPAFEAPDGDGDLAAIAATSGVVSYFRSGAAVLRDGFETGDTVGWSQTQGGS